MAQVELLQCLRDHEPAGIRVGEISDRLHLAAATTSGLVQQLVEAGTAERGPDPADRRAAVVRLTSAGRRQLAEWQQAHARRLGAALSALSSPQRAAVRTAVPALAALVHELSRADPVRRSIEAPIGRSDRRQAMTTSPGSEPTK